MQEAQVEISEDGAGLPELEKIQDYLNHIQITVYSYNNKGRVVYLYGQTQNPKLKINLFVKNYILL